MMSGKISAVLVFSVLLLCQCAPYRSAWNAGWTSAEAENSIMLVIDQPVTLGYKRLQYYGALHPEFRELLTHLGQPDCLAETTQGGRRYMILYYLGARKAYSCRTDDRRVTTPMQVSGPYPISDKEYKLLRTFQNKAYQSLGKKR